jgi:uncharacterized protein with ACT and thioredoxin-like domain
MKFEISTVKSFYNKEEAKKLKNIGFCFEKIQDCDDFYLDCRKKKVFININTLEELMNLQKIYGKLVINSETIIIYDDYLE